MKQHLKELLHQSIEILKKDQILPNDVPVNIQVERTRDKQHGDYASNIAMLLAKTAGVKPRDLAEKIVAHLPTSDWVKEVVIAGPGFINFLLTAQALYRVVPTILSEQDQFGLWPEFGQQKKSTLNLFPPILPARYTWAMAVAPSTEIR
jgi:arginyl-tRNA synthetase